MKNRLINKVEPQLLK